MIRRNGIYVIYGDNPGSMVKEMLSHIRPEQEIDKSALVGIKPNLVVAKPSSSGATTSPELVEGVVEYLYSKGIKRITILEGSWIGENTDDAFKVCGFEGISRRWGIPLINLQKDAYREHEVDGVKINVCKSILEIDYLINMPVMKGHCQTGMTCALKNMKGCIPDFEKRRFHAMGLHKPIACLNKIIGQDLVIVDGLAGDLNFEEGGNPVRMNRVIAGKDPVLVDAYVSRLMGFDPGDIPYIAMACKAGAGSMDTEGAEVIELNRDNSVGKIAPSGKAQKLAAHVCEDSACSACFGSLIHALERLDGNGVLRKLDTKLYIGQGFKNRHFDGIGIGSCAAGSGRHIPGCPPKGKDIVDHLRDYLDKIW